MILTQPRCFLTALCIGSAFAIPLHADTKIVDDAQTASELAIVTLNVVAAYFQNGVLRFDVDGDGQVSPIDVLIIINDLRRNGPRDLRPTDFPPIFFVDINGSGSVEPLDVLQVINFLFRQSRSGTGEGSKNDDLESSISSIAFETLERMRNVARSNLRLSP